ncbi:MAG: response regulator [Acidobacteria bacterium]|jgi:CheY-like chemotaxis protein|nr:response regulator [Acidobacteriota bacterium]
MSARVLIADDDRDARVLWTAVAEAENLQVVEAEDGRQAIEILKEDANFDLIILDVMMPFVEGYEVLKFIREEDRLAHIPVIISTADRTTRGLTGVPVDDRTAFISKASGLDNMRRGIIQSLGRKAE